MRDLNLLIVDDDELVLASLRTVIRPPWRLFTNNYESPLPNETFHAALVDMHLTGNIRRAEGLEVIQKLKLEQPFIEAIAMSGDLDIENMEKGLKAGASRFLAKPIQPEELQLNLDKIEELWLLRGAIQRGTIKSTPWLGQSLASQKVQEQVAAFKGEEGPFLIEGESGTGKEVVAQLLHSQRADRPFVAVNVASIPENLFESELFGHVKGAFTGADQNKMGLIEAAHGGDLFLDEIEAMPLPQQAKLLRFLESGEIRRVGAKESVIIKARVIAATNRPLKDLVAEKKFREDLLWRLSGKKIALPPLRERKDDISILANTFLNSDNRRKRELTDEGLVALQNYDWPGNVRELKRVCEQLLVACPLPVVRREDVARVVQPYSFVGQSTPIDFSLGLTRIVNEYEAHVITKCLEQYQDIDEVARHLDMSRSNLYKKIKDHNIQWRGM